MEHMAEVLRTADSALCTAYVKKSGMSTEEALDMMEQETWLTAEQAKEKKLIDAVMFDEEEEKPQMIAGPEFHLPDEEILAKARKLLRIEDEGEKGQYLKQKLALLKLKGEKR